MLRETFKQHIGLNKGFRFRGVEPGRLENFSDAVFALAITLLLISTSPPTSFEQIKRFVWDLIPFSICIVLIILIWHQHFIFFYRYGLRNSGVVVLNTLFLVIVLFYVYPLKFLTKFSLYPIALLAKQEWLATELSSMMSGKDMAYLMMIYGAGVSVVFFVLALMYRYALKRAREMELNNIEAFDTQASVTTNLLLASVPLLSVLLAFIFRNHVLAGAFSGFAYFLYWPVMLIYGKHVDKKRVQILKETNEATS
jgi:uncharacterized membrane protein